MYRLKVGKKFKPNSCNFKGCTYETWVYKKIIRLVIHVDLEDNWCDYQVVNASDGELYAPYYNRQYGKNKSIRLEITMDNKKLAELLFPDIKQTVEYYEEKYPKRDLFCYVSQ